MRVRWYLVYPLSTRHVEELMEERGVELDHRAIKRVTRPMLGFKAVRHGAVHLTRR